MKKHALASKRSALLSSKEFKIFSNNLTGIPQYSQNGFNDISFATYYEGTMICQCNINGCNKLTSKLPKFSFLLDMDVLQTIIEPSIIFPINWLMQMRQ